MRNVHGLIHEAKKIAVVGLSDRPGRASYGVALTLLELGFELYPVNPTIDSALGLPAYPSLRDVPVKVDIVDVFRRPEHVPDVARDAAAAGAATLWLQSGIRSASAREIALSAGMNYVEDRCLAVEARYAMRSRDIA